MTVRRDPYFKHIALLAQCDGPSGVIRDRSRNARVMTPNTFATNAADPYLGLNSFTGQPSFAGSLIASDPPNTITIEGWVKLSRTASTQTLISAMNAASGIECEWALHLTAGTTSRQVDFYQVIRGGSSGGGSPVLGSAFPSTAAWRHFFFCATPNLCWFGINGVMSPVAYCGFTSDHLGNTAINTRLNNNDPAISNSPNAGKLHSLCVSGIIRYPNRGLTTYTVPDDLFTNWYNDQGDPADVSATFYDAPLPSYTAAARFRQGDRKIAGHLTYQGANARKRVALFDRQSMLMVDQRYSSASDGSFEFVGLNANAEYFVLGLDDTPGTVNAEISDHVVAE